MSNLNLQKLREWVWPWPWTFKTHSSSRPTAPPSCSAKCLRFGHWL